MGAHAKLGIGRTRGTLAYRKGQLKMDMRAVDQHAERVEGHYKADTRGRCCAEC